MSDYNKAKQFADEAKELERQLFDEDGNRRETPEPTPEPVVEPVPEKVEEKKPEPVEPEPVKPDPEVVAEDKYKAAVKAMNEAQRETADLRKAQKDRDAKQVELETRLNDIAEAQKREASKVIEPEDDLEFDLPDVAKIADRKANKVREALDPRLSDIEKKLERFEAQQKQNADETAALTMRQDVIKTHPDFDEVVNSEAMQAWVNTEAPPMYKAIYDGSIPFTAKDVVEVVNRFKATLGTVAQVADVPSDKAAPVKTSSNPTSKGNTPQPLTEQEIVEFKNKQHLLPQAKKDEFNARLASMFS